MYSGGAGFTQPASVGQMQLQRCSEKQRRREKTSALLIQVLVHLDKCIEVADSFVQFIFSLAAVRYVCWWKHGIGLFSMYQSVCYVIVFALVIGFS